MSSNFFRFNVGRSAGVALRDGFFNYPLESFFANAPREEVAEVLRQNHLPTTQIGTPYTLLYLDTGTHRVLVDTGAGNLGAAAARLFPTVDHTTTIT